MNKQDLLQEAHNIGYNKGVRDSTKIAAVTKNVNIDPF